MIVLLLAIVIIVTITRNGNGWEGGGVEQVTSDAYVRGDLTPLSTKVAGLVHEMNVNDYQQVQKEDLLVQLDDDDGDRNFIASGTGLTQPLTELFKVKTRNDVARAELKASREKARGVENAVSLRVRGLYYNILGRVHTT